MYPHERSLVKNLADKPFVLLGVNSDENKAELKLAMEKEKITWRSWYDGSTSGPIARDWGVRGWPTIYVIDHKGVIRAKDVRGTALDQAILVLLKEAKADLAKQEKAKKAEEIATAKATTKTEDKASDDKDDSLAFTRLKFAKQLMDDGKTDKARERLQEIIKKYPKSTAADEARDLLKKLKK
jgi:FimV-like protein